MPNNNLSSSLDAQVIKTMTEQISKIAEQARQNVRNNTHIAQNIADAISTPSINKEGNNYVGKIVVSISKAPSAGAFEYGSGLHGKDGQKYPINAKNKPNLVFFWEKKGRLFIGPHVDHPGVKANPYLKPAVDDGIPKFREELAKSFKDAILSVTDKVTKIRAT